MKINIHVVRRIVALAYALIVIDGLIFSLVALQSKMSVGLYSAFTLMFSFAIVVTLVNLIRPSAFFATMKCSCGFSTASTRQFIMHAKDKHNADNVTLWLVD